MANGKHIATPARHFNVKAISVVLVLVLLIGGMIGGTVAWLIDKSDSVVNTFTYGDINIELDETDTGLDNDGNDTTNEYKMIPGQTIGKDPTITVKSGSENNWLFVKLVKSTNFDNFMTFTIADGWTQLYDVQGNEVEGVYFRFQSETDVDVAYPVLKDDQVIVKGEVTKQMLNALDADETYPKLTVTAYAVQYAGFEPEITEGQANATEAQVQAAAYKAWTEAVAANANP